MGIVRTNSTFARVSFFTFDLVSAGPQPGRIDTYESTGIPAVDNSRAVATTLIGFNHTKRMGGASGDVTINLKAHTLAGKPWVEVIEQGDWWMIDIIKNGVSQGLSFGIIDTVTTDMNAARGEGATTVTVTGRDVGFALDDTPVYFNPLDPNIDHALGIVLITTIESLIGRPNSVVVAAVKALLGGDSILGGHTAIPIDLSRINASRWVDFIDLTTCVDPFLQGNVSQVNVLSPEGAKSVWGYLDSWRNPLLNELFIDPVPLPGTPKKACLVMREKPFVDVDLGLFSPWYNLLTWNIEASTVRQCSLTRGANRINHVQVVGDMLADMNQDGLAFYAPKMNKESVKRFGLHRLEERTRYWDDQSHATVGASEAGGLGLQPWLKTVTGWNALNHEYWQGQLSLGEMRAEIRIGQRVAVFGEMAPGLPGEGATPLPLTVPYLDPRAFSLYVEGVSHSYTEAAQPIAQTNIMVSRGYVEGERLPRLTAEMAKWSLGIPGVPPFAPNPARPHAQTPNIVNDAQARSIQTTPLAGARGPNDFDAEPS